MPNVIYFGLLFLSMGGLSSLMYSAKYSVVSVSGNIDLCDKLFKEEEQHIPSWYSKYTCYQDFAVSRKDEKLCEKIPKGDKLMKNRNRCYLWIAIDKNDSALCSKIEDFPIYSNLPNYNHCLEAFE